MQNQRISFDNDRGEKLSGLLNFPAGEPRAFALFAHCFTCTKNLKGATNISRSLTDAGIAVLRFDFTGLGQSEGDFADSNFSSNVSDLLAAARYWRPNTRRRRYSSVTRSAERQSCRRRPRSHRPLPLRR